MILFNDSDWKYNFIIIMIGIIVISGIYTLIKIRSPKKKNSENINTNKKNKPNNK